MIAKRRHLATQDFVLIVIAAGIVILSCLPLAPPRRQVRIRLATGQFQTFSMSLDNPLLERLENRLSVPERRPGPSAALAVAEWQAEIAALYAERCKPSEIQQVSFGERRDADTSANVQRRYQNWLTLSQEAQAQVDRLEKEEAREPTASPQPFEMGELIPARRTAKANLAAFLCGVTVALIFGIWSFLAPTVELASNAKPSGETNETDPARTFDFMFSIPRDWVRVRQSPSVWIRRAAQAALVVGALLVLIRGQI